MRRIWDSLGYQILHAGRILRANSAAWQIVGQNATNRGCGVTQS